MADDRPGTAGDDAVIMQSASNAFRYVECDIPAGVTVGEWRRRTARPTRRRVFRKG